MATLGARGAHRLWGWNLMSDVPAAMAPDEARRLAALCEKLAADAGAAWAAVVSGAGHFLAASDRPPPADTTQLASLVAGGMAATGAVAQLVGEALFPAMLLEGRSTSLYLAGLGHGGIVVVAFAVGANIGLVRLRTAQATDSMAAVLAGMRAPAAAPGAALAITDADIDALFGA